MIFLTRIVIMCWIKLDQWLIERALICKVPFYSILFHSPFIAFIAFWRSLSRYLYLCKYWVTINTRLGDVNSNMHFRYCSLTGSIKPRLQYVYTCRVRRLSNFHFVSIFFIIWTTHLKYRRNNYKNFNTMTIILLFSAPFK
jgi:hypothetical protein